MAITSGSSLPGVMGVGKTNSLKRPRKEAEKDQNIVIDSGICGGESEHEVHIWTERQRRKKMRDMFSNLHSLLPQLPAKADKSTIVDEAVSYIEILEKTLATMQRKRLEKPSGCVTITDYNNGASGMSTTCHTPQLVVADSREALLADQASISSYSNTTTGFCLNPTCFQFQTWFSPNVVMNMCGEDAQFGICSLKKPGLFCTVIYILDKHNLEVVSAHLSSDQYRSIHMIHVRYAGGDCRDALSVEDTFKLAAGEINLCLLSCSFIKNT